MPSFGANALAVLAPMTLLLACAEAPTIAPAAADPSILKSSTPGDGSTVRGPLNLLELRFSPSARLGEVTVTGGDGTTMPMMVTAVGETPYYSLPLPSLGPGAYTVTWKATAAGERHQGMIRFTVR